MQSAFFGFRMFPPPASGTFVFAGLEGARAGTATDTGKALVMQWVIRYLLDFEITPDVSARPLGQWAEFGEAVIGIPGFAG